VIESVALDGGSARVHVRHWGSTGASIGSVVVLHGIQSHGGWYVNSCSQLADAGFQVLVPDRRGSGLNTDRRGDAPSFRRLLDDVAEIMNRAAPPRFLLGISWGGKLAVGFQRRHPSATNGLILCAPGLFQRVDLSFTDKLRILGWRFVSPTKQFPIPLNDPSFFTDTADYQRFIRDDSLGLRTATARLLFESARMDVYNHWAARFVTCPTLAFFAEHDRISDNPKTRHFISRFRTPQVEIHEYPRAHHTLEFEPGGPPFMRDVLDWLRRHAGTR